MKKFTKIVPLFLAIGINSITLSCQAGKEDSAIALPQDQPLPQTSPTTESVVANINELLNRCVLENNHQTELSDQEIELPLLKNYPSNREAFFAQSIAFELFKIWQDTITKEKETVKQKELDQKETYGDNAFEDCTERKPEKAIVVPKKQNKEEMEIIKEMSATLWGFFIGVNNNIPYLCADQAYDHLENLEPLTQVERTNRKTLIDLLDEYKTIIYNEIVFNRAERKEEIAAKIVQKYSAFFEKYKILLRTAETEPSMTELDKQKVQKNSTLLKLSYCHFYSSYRWENPIFQLSRYGFSLLMFCMVVFLGLTIGLIDGLR